MNYFRVLMLTALVAVPTLCALVAAERSPAAMATAANRWLAALTPEQRQKATFAFDSAERMRWHFIPTEMFARYGLTIKEMTEPQRQLAHAILQAGLSERGYMTATAIMDLENILRLLESNGQFARDQERYFFSIFGTPSERGAWGWRVEGHHVSLHFTVVNGRLVTSAPTFFGSNPAEVRSGPKAGSRVLGAQEDPARALVTALDEGQRRQAVILGAAPSDIVTMNQLAIEPLAPSGIAASALSSPQKGLLTQLISAYTSLMNDELARERMARLEKAGLDRITFAWAGEVERGKKHYYRVQGPTFLIEYDNTQNDGNHVHSVWRDFGEDFGRDILREHVSAFHQ